MELVILKGLPFSGKSEWARRWCAESSRRVRISWSEQLGMMGRGFSRELRPLAVESCLHLMQRSFRDGFDVVLDEENLLPFEWVLFVSRAQVCKARVRWVSMPVDVEESKRRNARAGHPVADMEIERKAERFADWLKK